MLSLKCQECGRTFTYPHQLRGHRRVHTMMNRTMYRCKVCNTTFSYLSSLRQHLTSHFGHTSGDNQYMDDLAIGVTIEPVHETACHPAGTRGQGVVPRHCERGLVVGHSQSGLGCGERCSGHRTSPCCCKTRPMARCGSVMLIDPRQVVHVDMTHDPSLSYPVCEVPWTGSVVPENVGPGNLVSGRVVPENMVLGNMVPRSVVPDSIVPSSVVPGSAVPESAVPESAVPESMVPGNMVHGSAISVEDQDRSGHSFREEHMQEDVAEERYADDDSEVGWMFPPAESEDTSNCPREPGQDIPAAEGSVRPVVSQNDVFSVDDVTLPVSSEVLDSIVPSRCDPAVAVAVVEGGISGFDDMATCNDLSNFFPDFNEKSETKPIADSKSGNTSNDRNSLAYEEDALHPLATGLDSVYPASVYPASPRGLGHRTDLSSSDLEACVKLGLDSTALNPTVVVNDLQKEIARLQRAVGGEVKGEDSYCDLCDVRFNNNKLHLKHVRLHRGLLGKGKGSTAESGNGNPDGGYTLQPPSRPQNKMKEDVLMNCVEKVGKTFPNRKPGPKFRVTVSKMNIKCYICGRHYATKQYFIAHAKRHLKKLGYSQAKQDLFYCTICYAFYPREDKLREHLVDVHSNDEPTAQLTRKRKRTPRASVKGRTGIQANMTTDSDFAESTTDQLVFPEFESDVEGGIQPEIASTDTCYGICHVCGTAFSSETGLSQHISSCRGGRPKESPRRIQKPVAPKQPAGKKIGFKCHICERIFPAVKNLKNHFVSHDPRRTKLMCPITNCKGNYIWKQNFKRHLLSHATPRGQKFHKVMFDLHNDMFCPFCKRMMFFVSLEEYKTHMLVHVNKIMADECERNDLSYRVKLVTLKKAAVNRPKAPMQSELSTKPEYKHDVGGRSMASATLSTEDNTRKHPFPAAQSSTPNSCFGFADAVSNDIYSGDVSPGGSLQGNSGLFISPVWAPAAYNEIQPKGVYSQVRAPQQSAPSRPGDCPSRQDSKSQLQTDLNDSGFTQMLSGDSDHGELSRELTPQQGLPSFDYFSRNTRDPRQAASTTAPDRNAQNEDVQHCAANTDSVFHKHKKDRLSYGLKERPAYSLKEDRPAYSLKEERPVYGLKEDRKAYGLNEDRPAYGLNEDRSSYGLKEDMPAYGLEEDTPAYAIGYFPKHRGKSTTSIFMTQKRAAQLMKSSCEITANFLSKGLLCSICGQVKLDMDNVKTHLLSHFDASGKFAFNTQQEGRQFICPLCFKVMLCRRSTTAHLFSHWGLNLIKCPVCYKIFNLVKTLNNHVHKAHPHYRYK